MKKPVSSILILTILFNQNLLNAFSFPSITKKQITNAIAMASGILSIPCFKKCHDLSQEYDSLLRSVVPNFEELFEAECDKCLFITDTTRCRLWDKFFETNVRPDHPEIIPQLNALNYKALAFFIAGTALATTAIICAFAKSKEAASSLETY